MRYLFGPVTSSFPAHARAAGADAVYFGAPGPGVVVAPADCSWDDLSPLLPDGPAPEALVLWPAYQEVPPRLWDAPVPVIALLADWNLHYHRFRRDVLPRCDLALTDVPGVEIFRRAGFDHVRAANLYGLGPEYLAEEADPNAPRDIDVLFVGNLNPAVQRERLPWLARLARLKAKYNVMIRTGVVDAPYRDLLRRAKIIFNRSARGECNQRAFEAVNAGALLLQERDNAEVPLYLKDGVEYASYGEDDFEAVVERHLSDDEARRAIAQAAYARRHEFSFAALLSKALESLEPEWEAIKDRAAHRLASPCVIELDDAAGPMAAGLTAPGHLEAAACFDLALSREPNHPIAALDLAEVLARAGRKEEAIAQAHRTLQAVDAAGDASVSSAEPLFYPAGYHLLRVEWERAAFIHAGDPEAEVTAKLALLRGRLHALLGELTRELGHYEAAVAARLDLPTARAALGCALALVGKLPEAVEQLRIAVAGDPFDRGASRAFFQALLDSKDHDAAARFAAERRLLSEVAPDAVPAEPWFDPTAPAPKTAAPRTDAVPLAAASFARLMSRPEFTSRFGGPDTSRALSGFTVPADTHAVLTLLAHAKAKRILEVGTAAGHMTANLAEWSPDDALVYSMGDVADLPAGRSAGQASETPPRAAFGRHADHFGKAGKVMFLTADSLHYDFGRLAPLDFAFIDGAHDFAHVLSDTRKAYAALRAGGWLVWHDFGSPTPWVEVEKAVAAAGLPEPVWCVEGTEVAFLRKDPHNAPPALPELPLCVAWEGDVAEVHSLAAVNRALCERLAHRGHLVTVRPAGTVPAGKLPGQHPSLRLVGRPLPRVADVTVRHRWPADFTRSAEGKLVVVLPWEFGSPPKAWGDALSTGAVDEVWVPSRAVRECFVRGGVPASLVQVVPNGVDVSVYRPGLEPYPLSSRQRFRFLYTGGTIWRKGFDVLLEMYGRTFSAADDVCLVVKDTGVGTFYQGQTAERQIAEFRSRAGAPAVEYLSADLSESDLARLYAACDCLVSPYRGEGFGLPVAEAMACGLPVVVTAGGSTDDWCNDANSYRVSSRPTRFQEKRAGGLETIDFPWMLEPDAEALAAILRRVVAEPAERLAKARAGCAVVRGRLTWDRATAVAERRLMELTGGAPHIGHAVADEVHLVPAPHTGPRPKVSLFMIVKNEEKNLPDCLGPLRGVVDDIVVADTGSSDRTREIATSFGARVIEAPWQDSFSAARNAALAHAWGEWAFWMDADDRLDATNQLKLKALFDSLNGDNAAFVMKCLCVARTPGETATVVDHVRLFRNDPKHRWNFRVHEQILPSLRANGADVRWSDVIVLHTGYTDPALRRRKLERDLRLLRLEDADQPGHPFTLFNLGSVYHELGRPQEAVTVLGSSLAKSHPKDSIVRKLYALIAQCRRDLGQGEAALAACAEGRRHYPEDAELLFHESILLRDKGDMPGAENRLRKLIAGTESDHFASVDTGLRRHKARHNLAVLLQDQGRLAEAEREFEAALQHEPAFLPAHRGLAELRLTEKNWAGLERSVEALRDVGFPVAQIEAEALAARGRIEREEYEPARLGLREALVRFPNVLRLRLLLARALLKGGAPAPVAEQALRDVLALDPENAEAKHNLAVLLRGAAQAVGGRPD